MEVIVFGMSDDASISSNIRLCSKNQMLRMLKDSNDRGEDVSKI